MHPHTWLLVLACGLSGCWDWTVHPVRAADASGDASTAPDASDAGDGASLDALPPTDGALDAADAIDAIDAVFATDVTDAADTVDAPPPVDASANLLTNPDCETSTTGWSSYRGTVTRHLTSTAHTGTATCLVAWDGSGPGFSLNSDGQTWSFAAGGTPTFRASAWVRSLTTTGRRVSLHIRFGGGTAAAATFDSVEYTLTGAWQQLALQATADRTDRTQVHPFVMQDASMTGDTMEVDDVVLQQIWP